MKLNTDQVVWLSTVLGHLQRVMENKDPDTPLDEALISLETSGFGPTWEWEHDYDAGGEDVFVAATLRHRVVIIPRGDNEIELFMEELDA